MVNKYLMLLLVLFGCNQLHANTSNLAEDLINELLKRNCTKECLSTPVDENKDLFEELLLKNIMKKAHNDLKIIHRINQARERTKQLLATSTEKKKLQLIAQSESKLNEYKELLLAQLESRNNLVAGSCGTVVLTAVITSLIIRKPIVLYTTLASVLAATVIAGSFIEDTEGIENSIAYSKNSIEKIKQLIEQSQTDNTQPFEQIMEEQ